MTTMLLLYYKVKDFSIRRNQIDKKNKKVKIHDIIKIMSGGTI